ncbi:hypothetical protein DQ397_001115 [Pseudomonas sp. CK-NBRI-02]|uniref:hypothetical protein n=1 Tax=Pseudomonas sp. CK-NBRI-02 TaxID=2249759 RepID=UPI0011E80437|nr:hypothetical protein [Pseudomonas sp. CK-NBRI-02]TYO83313.1 hypothetical protein DQ397_001115 [Pseudomonas sp. CK-NBRI-02]
MVPGEHSRWQRQEPRTGPSQADPQVGKPDQSVEIVAFLWEILQNSAFDVKTVAFTMDRVHKSFAIIGLISAAIGITAFLSNDSQPEKSSDFLGISFDKDFLKEIPVCNDDNNPPELCRVSTSDPKKFEIRGLPYLPVSPGYKATVTTDNNNKPINLILSGKTQNFKNVRLMADIYFGDPTEVIENWSWKSESGSFNNEAYRWKTASTVIDLHRSEEDLSTYLINISKPVNSKPSEEAVSSTDI